MVGKSKGKHCEEKYVHFKDSFFMAATFVSHFCFFSESASAYCLMSFSILLPQVSLTLEKQSGGGRLWILI